VQSVFLTNENANKSQLLITECYHTHANILCIKSICILMTTTQFRSLNKKKQQSFGDILYTTNVRFSKSRYSGLPEIKYQSQKY
jgi:hypothetical protein